MREGAGILSGAVAGTLSSRRLLNKFVNKITSKNTLSRSIGGALVGVGGIAGGVLGSRGGFLAANRSRTPDGRAAFAGHKIKDSPDRMTKRLVDQEINYFAKEYKDHPEEVEQIPLLRKALTNIYGKEIRNIYKNK